MTKHRIKELLLAIAVLSVAATGSQADDDYELQATVQTPDIEFVSDTDIGLWARFTEDISVYSSHDFQQSGLARPVQAEDTYFGAWKKRQRYVFQNLFFWGDNFSHAVHGVNVLRQGKTPMVWLKRDIPWELSPDGQIIGAKPALVEMPLPGVRLCAAWKLAHSSRISTIEDLMTSSSFCSVSFHTTRRSLLGFAGTSASRNSIVLISPVFQCLKVMNFLVIRSSASQMEFEFSAISLRSAHHCDISEGENLSRDISALEN